MQGSGIESQDDLIVTVPGSTLNALAVVLTTALVIECAYPGAVMGGLAPFVLGARGYEQVNYEHIQPRGTLSVPKSPAASLSFADRWDDAVRPDWFNWTGYKVDRVELIAPAKPATRLAASPAPTPPSSTQPAAVSATRHLPAKPKPVLAARPAAPHYAGTSGAPAGTGFGFGFR